MKNKQTVVNTSDFIEACEMVQEIVGDFVCMSNNSTQEIVMANRLMRLQSLLLEMEESE